MYGITESYDRTDSEAEPGYNVEGTETVTDFRPDDPPSYTDFLIGYPTQSCEFFDEIFINM